MLDVVGLLGSGPQSPAFNVDVMCLPSSNTTGINIVHGNWHPRPLDAVAERHKFRNDTTSRLTVGDPEGRLANSWFHSTTVVDNAPAPYPPIRPRLARIAIVPGSISDQSTGGFTVPR